MCSKKIELKPLKFHKNIFEAVVQNCHVIFNEGRYADKVIEFSLKNHKQWGARDRAFVASHTYDLVRWKRLLQFITENEERTDLAALWLMLGALRWKQNQPIPEWSEFRNLNGYVLEKKLSLAETDRRLMASIPDWMDELGAEELGRKWDEEIIALNHAAPLYIRVNTLKTNRQVLMRKLSDLDIQTKMIDTHEDALLVQKRVNLFSNPLFQQGHFEVQDIASQWVAPFLDVKPGMRVIDACAGAGGKSLHIAAYMQNKGKIISMDTEGWKLDELKRRAKRAGIDNIETKEIDSNKIIKRLEATADRLLLDVPCSGLGVLRRNPDAKWKLKPEFIEAIRQTQLQIIQEYSIMLKPGGKMVYATCSILPSEDELQVAKFLATNNEFTLEQEKRTWPSEGMDGFYMARLVRKG